MTRMYRSPIFRNNPFLGELVDEEEEDDRLMAMNPAGQTRPVTLALDILEVAHQLGAPYGMTRFDAEGWASVFYRGDDARASRDAKLRAYERWKHAVREAGFDCTPEGRAQDPEGYLAAPYFCVDMTRALPWAEGVLEQSARRAAERRRVPVPTSRSRAAGKLVRLYDKPVVKAPRPHNYVKPVGGRVSTSPCAVCGEPASAHAATGVGRVGNPPRWRVRA